MPKGNKCKKCGVSFNAKPELKIHDDAIHKESMNRDVALLLTGYVPEESKIGEPFKGRNRVIIA